MADILVFRILTTTACNASCSYCYERGTQLVVMNDDTAEQTAAFICEQVKAAGLEAPVHLEWFGGEPTLNLKAADDISRILLDKKVWFSSSMVTNAFLMDERIYVERISLWQLRSVQVTLDGPEAVHERIKGLPGGSFARILHNINLMAEQGIHVKLRLNYDGRKEDAVRLIEGLRDAFSGNDHIHAYFSPVYTRCREVPRAFMLEILELTDRLIEASLASEKSCYALRERSYGCFMTREHGFTIAPDGRLFNCSHNMTDEQCVGTVWDYDPDHTVRRAFLFCELSDECRQCEMLAFCKGGCRAAQIGLADMFRCHPYKSVFDEVQKRMSALN